VRGSRFGRSVLGVVAVGALVACSHGSKSKASTATTVAAPSTGPAAIVFRSAEKTAAAKTTKFDLSLIYASFPGSNAPITVAGGGVFDFRATKGTLHLDLGPLFGTLSAADRAKLQADAGNVDVVFDHSTFFLRAPIVTSQQPTLKPWLKVDVSKIDKATDVSGNLDQLQNLGGGNDPGVRVAVLLGTTDATEVGPEDIGGTPTTHYRANVDVNRAKGRAKSVTNPDRFASFVKLLGTTTLPVDVWIDGTGRVRQLSFVVTSKSSTATSNPPSYTIKLGYHDFGSTVNVSDPPDDQVTDLVELNKKAQRATTTT